MAHLLISGDISISLAIAYAIVGGKLFLISKNYIAKRSWELDVAKKYKKVLEDAGCIAVIESEFDFDDPISIPQKTS